MPNVLYNPAKEKLLNPTGTIGGTAGTNFQLGTGGDTLNVVLCSAGYTFAASDEFLDPAIVLGNRVGTPTALTSQTVSSAGVFDAADITFSAVSGSQITQVVIYKATGTETTSSLLVYFDTMTGLPVTPNGGDITIAWNASGIFGL